MNGQKKGCNNFVLKNNNNLITYTKCGSGEVLVFIHAGGMNKSMWDNQLEYFKQKYTVIAYDIRGHHTATFSENDQYEFEDLNAVLKKENIDKIHLVGCSLGAIIALDFALMYPEKS